MKKNFLWLALVIAFFAVPLATGSNYIYSVLIVTGIYAVVVQGLGILMGFCGQVSLGHAAFFGIGAYSVAVLTARCGWPEVLALASAVVVPAVISAVIGLPVLKLRELYLAMGTLGFGLLVHIFFNEAAALTGGPSGMGGIPYLSFGGAVLDTDSEFFVFIWIVVAVISLFIHNLINSRTGRALRAVKDSEHAAEAVGIDTALLKLKALVLSASLAGLAGGLYAFYVTFISPSPFGFHTSVQLVLMAVVGGPGTVLGPLIGAAVVVVMGEFVKWAVPLAIPGAGGEYEIIFFGLFLVFLMVACPDGVGSFRKKIFLKKSRAKESVKACAYPEVD